MAKSKKLNKRVVVNRKFVLDLANRIYNPKTRKFLRLCDGTLQNGPDPTDAARPMHCGLGELYFAMTGRQPHDDNVSEGDVIDLAVELSTIETHYERAEKEALDAAQLEAKRVEKALKKLNINKSLLAELLVEVDIYASDPDSWTEWTDVRIADAIEDFRAALGEIPEENDDGHGDSTFVEEYDLETGTVCSRRGCSYEQYRARSCRVARQLREAAKCLPE